MSETSASGAADVLAFMDRVHDATRAHAPGKRRVEVEALREVVRGTDPDIVVLGVRGFLMQAEYVAAPSGHYQLALTVAAMFQAETGDDSLEMLVKRTMQEAGVQEMPEFILPEGSAEQSPKGYHFAISQETLDRCDVYPVVRLLSFERAAEADTTILAGLRGRCLLTFDLPDDGKYVWEDPRVRAYVAALFEALPYFPYYLKNSPDQNQLLMVYGCLADPEAIGPGGGIALGHDSIVQPSLTTIVALFDVCRQTQEAPAEVIAEVFTTWPQDMFDYLLRELNAIMERKGPNGG